LLDYPWTSHRAMMGRTHFPWLERDDVLGRFDRDGAAARRKYEQFLIDRWSQGYRHDLEGGGLLRSSGGMAAALENRRSGNSQIADIRILGDGQFVETILRQADEIDHTAKTIARAWDLESLTQTVAGLHCARAEDVRAKDCSRPISRARALIVYAAKEWLGLTGAAVQRWLGISSGSVTKAYRRGRILAADGKLLAELNRKKGSNVP